MITIRNQIDWAVDLARTSVRRLAAAELLTGYIGWTWVNNLGDQAMLEAACRLFGGANFEPFSRCAAGGTACAYRPFGWRDISPHSSRRGDVASMTVILA